MGSILYLLFVTGVSHALVTPATIVGSRRSLISTNRESKLLAFSSEASPSDYSTEDLVKEKAVTVDENEEDAVIRDDLKRELLLLSSVTNRGEYATLEDQNMLVDIVSQLEALNPTPNPSSNSEGEWDLCLSSTQLFRSSPFFQSIRVAMGENKLMAENAFDLHDRSTTFGRMGRVRQTITSDKLISEVALDVGIFPGLPIRVKGTVVSTASLNVISPQTFETRIEATEVKGSNVPLFNQFLDDLNFELPVGDLYNAVTGSVPVVSWNTFYLDEALRIVRDLDDNFFVFTRS
jgi:hypothetical protein